MTRANVEHELEDGVRTGRWHARQFYGQVGDRRPPSQRTPAEWRGTRATYPSRKEGT